MDILARWEEGVVEKALRARGLRILGRKRREGRRGGMVVRVW